MHKQNTNSIKNWSHDDRPREKMIDKGRSALSDAELLAILMRSGNREESAVSLAQKILKDVNNDLSLLAKLPVDKLMKYKGVGTAKALSITAALELGRRRREAKIKKSNSIKSSKDVFEFMQSIITDLEYEEFWGVFLDVKNQIILRSPISVGGVASTLVDIKKIFKIAIENNAVNIIVCHNHPSGFVDPSKNDISLTNRIKEASIILNLTFCDHLIFGRETYFSFADSGLLD